MRKAYMIVGIVGALMLAAPVVAEACQASHNATVLVNDWLSGNNDRGAVSNNDGSGAIVRQHVDVAAFDGGGSGQFGNGGIGAVGSHVSVRKGSTLLNRFAFYGSYDGFGAQDQARARTVINFIKDWFQTNVRGAPSVQNVDKSDDSYSG